MLDDEKPAQDRAQWEPMPLETGPESQRLTVGGRFPAYGPAYVLWISIYFHIFFILLKVKEVQFKEYLTWYL